jgi:beta-1,4-mannosyl-glycoprotein beta-1,4-N-acetylglucosaminyltransferase
MTENLSIPPKVYDCFIFYNELDLLEIRLNELNDVVDYFVLVEGEKTFQNTDKILYYNENKDNENLIKFKDKIIHIIVSANQFNDYTWHNEEQQWISIQNGLINSDENDMIIVGALDEIPKASTIKKLKEESFNSVGCLLQKFYYFFLDTKYEILHQGDFWYGNLITPRKFVGSNLYHFFLENRNGNVAINDGGWHFSFMGDYKTAVNKVNSYSHTEFKHLTEDNMKDFIDKLQDPLGRNGATWFCGHEKLEELPMYVQQNIEKYKKYIHQLK